MGDVGVYEMSVWGPLLAATATRITTRENKKQDTIKKTYPKADDVLKWKNFSFVVGCTTFQFLLFAH